MIFNRLSAFAIALLICTDQDNVLRFLATLSTCTITPRFNSDSSLHVPSQLGLTVTIEYMYHH